MTRCELPVDAFVHPALRGRFSPVRFDALATVTDAQVDTLLDAARLAPSAGNSQPWAFVAGRRGDPVHAGIVRHLARSSSAWAPDASLLVLNLAHVLVEGTDWEYSEFARYDLGQAVAHMTVQGLTLGLAAHQFRAFDREALATEFAIPPEWEVTSAIAIGRADHAPGEVPAAGVSRQRRSRDDVTWARAR